MNGLSQRLRKQWAVWLIIAVALFVSGSAIAATIVQYGAVYGRANVLTPAGNRVFVAFDVRGFEVDDPQSGLPLEESGQYEEARVLSASEIEGYVEQLERIDATFSGDGPGEEVEVMTL